MVIYPNPTNSVLTIELENAATINIVNMLGDVLRTEQINGFSKIDVSNLTSGIYFIQDLKSGKPLSLLKNNS